MDSTTQNGVRAAMLRVGRSSARASAEAKAKAKSEARDFGEEGWPVGAVLLTVDMLWGGKDGPNFGVGMCSEIWLRWEGPGTSPFCSKENHVSSTSIFLARSCWVFLLGICRENMLMND